MDGTLVLVMELVEGEDLGQRLARGPIPLDEALPVARQVAEALEAAHERGVVHRDLKPANVKVTAEGKVKILDFGLAKAWAADEARAPSPADSSQSPTAAHTGTAAGIILGTAAYMSPEQARGRAVDRRADIWAFGVLLHEMLTGRGLFAGETVSDTLAAVLTRQPDWEALPAGTPAGICQLLARCLERDARRRLRDIGEARVALEQAEQPLPPAPAAGPRPRSARALTPWLLLPVAAAAGFAAAWLLPNSTASSRPVRASLLPPAGTDFFFDGRQPGSPSLSADGKLIAFAARGSKGDVRAREHGYLDLYERDLDSDEERLLLRTDEDKLPTSISPDGRLLAYLVSLGRRGIWMLPLQGGGAPFLFRSSDSPQENAQFSPDGRWIAFEQTESARKDVYVTSFPKPGPAWRVSADGGETPRWSSDGRAIFFLSGDNRLMASTVVPRAPELEIGAPSLVGDLSVRVSGIASGHGAESNYDVRGDRFLVLAARSARSQPLNLLLDWTALTR